MDISDGRRNTINQKRRPRALRAPPRTRRGLRTRARAGARKKLSEICGNHSSRTRERRREKLLRVELSPRSAAVVSTALLSLVDIISHRDGLTVQAVSRLGATLPLRITAFTHLAAEREKERKRARSIREKYRNIGTLHYTVYTKRIREIYAYILAMRDEEYCRNNYHQLPLQLFVKNCRARSL